LYVVGREPHCLVAKSEARYFNRLNELLTKNDMEPMTRSFSSLSIRELLTTHERKEKKSVQRMIRSNTTELGFLRCHQVDVSATNTCTDTVVSVVDTQKGSAYESEILFRSTGAESVVLKSQTSIACLSIAASCSTKSIGMYFYRR